MNVVAHTTAIRRHEWCGGMKDTRGVVSGVALWRHLTFGAARLIRVGAWIGRIFSGLGGFWTLFGIGDEGSLVGGLKTGEEIVKSGKLLVHTDGVGVDRVFDGVNFGFSGIDLGGGGLGLFADLGDGEFGGGFQGVDLLLQIDSYFFEFGGEGSGDG